VYRSVHAASAKQGSVGGVDDCVNTLLSNIAANHEDSTADTRRIVSLLTVSAHVDHTSFGICSGIHHHPL
jgi:hypothetical protein